MIDQLHLMTAYLTEHLPMLVHGPSDPRQLGTMFLVIAVVIGIGGAAINGPSPDVDDEEDYE